jgi:dienelactone hydrolase
MSMSATETTPSRSVPAAGARPFSRLLAAARTEAGLARLALGAVALHVLDDNFLQPNPGMSAADHLAGGLFQLTLVVAAIAFYPRLRAGARATVAILGGWFGILVGTEAVYYTREVGPSGDDYTGLLSIPAGLLLLGIGAVTLWRSRKTGDRLWWRYSRRALVAAGAFLVGSMVLFTFSFAYVITHAGRAHVPTADLGAPYEEVQFRTSDGLLLEGWYIESRNGAAVISFPGRAASQTRAKMLADHGYGVLLFDRRGEGESEGDFNILGWQGERDIHAAVAFLQNRPDVDPEKIGGIGLSVGGEMMIEAAAESSALRAIMSEGGSGRSVRDDWVNDAVSWDVLLGRTFFTAAAAVSTSDLPPADLKSLVPKISGSVFFVYGAEGQPEEKPANEGWYAEARGPKEIWEVPGSGHMKGIEAQPQEYERRVVGFFDRALLGQGGGS